MANIRAAGVHRMERRNLKGENRIEQTMNKDRKVALLLYLAHCYCISKCKFQQFSEDTYTRESSLDNRISDDNISTIIKQGQTHCAQSCSVSDDCVSFFYLMSARHCKLLNHIVDSEMSTRSEHGWKYYIQEGYSTTYNVTLVTGDVDYASTDANVYIQFFGINGKLTKRLYMDDERDNFERNVTEDFQLVDVDVGPMDYIVVGHDNSGREPGWFLDHVLVKRYLREKEVNEYTATLPTAFGRPVYEEYYFTCNLWLAVDEDDGLIERELTYNVAYTIFEDPVS